MIIPDDDDKIAVGLSAVLWVSILGILFSVSDGDASSSLASFNADEVTTTTTSFSSPLVMMLDSNSAMARNSNGGAGGVLLCCQWKQQRILARTAVGKLCCREKKGDSSSLFFFLFQHSPFIGWKSTECQLYNIYWRITDGGVFLHLSLRNIEFIRLFTEKELCSHTLFCLWSADLSSPCTWNNKNNPRWYIYPQPQNTCLSQQLTSIAFFLLSLALSTTIVNVLHQPPLCVLGFWKSLRER